MKYTYLLINFFTVLLPFLWSFESKLKFYSKWKYCFPAILATALFFLIWDYFKTLYGVWGFNTKYVTGVKIGNLPIEEILFFITVPYACIFIYESAGFYLKRRLFVLKNNKAVFVISALLFFVLSFLAWGRVYTWSVLFLSAIVLPILAYKLTDRQLTLFCISYLISLLPMLVVNGLLTWLPVVWYNNTQNTGIRLGSIPVEDFLYFFILLSINIVLYEILSSWNFNIVYSQVSAKTDKG